MKVVIPMAGAGSRFAQAGYELPKPLIDVNGKPMIQRVVENLDFEDITEYIFIVRTEHMEKYNLRAALEFICKGRKCIIIQTDQLLQGSAKSLELAFPYLENPDEVLVANSDQLVEYDRNNFETLRKACSHGTIVWTFYADNPKFSYVSLNKKYNHIDKVAEKEVISNFANVGVFYFRYAFRLIHNIKEMFKEQKTVNGEYYLAPSINYSIKDGISVVPFFVNKMHCLGDPESLEYYVKLYKS